MIRSTTFQLIVPNEAYPKILNSIKLYRAVARQLFSACTMAEIAGSKIEIKKDNLQITPGNDEAKKILSSAFGMDGKAHLYQCRSWVLSESAPTWLSFVWDSVRQDVSSRWRAPDSEFVKARRGWLVLQGARSISQFNHIGIGFPVATAHPKLHEHKLVLKWDKEIGPVEFTIPSLDGGRYHIWKNLREETPGWRLGTSYLNERDGKIRVTVSYECPDKKMDLDKDSTLSVEFTSEPESFICVHNQDKNFSADKISAQEVLNWLYELNKKREHFEGCRMAIGNKHKKWGSPTIWNAIQKRVSNLTERRKNGEKTRNHLWTRRIIEDIERTRCGQVTIKNFPEKELFGHPWAWSQFRQFLNYKAEEIGAKIIYE